MISNLRFIINESQKLFVIIDRNDITLVDRGNEKPHSGFSLPEIVFRDIIKRFDRRAEYLRISYKNEVLRKTKTSLQIIKEKI